jgi:hypothetical protein
VGADPVTGKVWGYDNPGTATTSGSSMFSTLRYVTRAATPKDLSYMFGALEPCQCTVYVGLFDPLPSGRRGSISYPEIIALGNELVTIVSRTRALPPSDVLSEKVPSAT